MEIEMKLLQYFISINNILSGQNIYGRNKTTKRGIIDE